MSEERNLYKGTEQGRSSSVRKPAADCGEESTLKIRIEKLSIHLYVRAEKRNLHHTEIRTENIAHMSVTFPTDSEVAAMSEKDNERLYYVSLSVAKTMLKQGIISEESYRVISTKLLEKYRPVSATLKSGKPLNL